MAQGERDHAELLKRAPIFADVSERTLKRLATAATVVSCARGDVLFEAGADPDYLHILVDGTVQLATGTPDGREAVVEIIRPVDAFIMAAVLTSQPFLMSAKAVEPSRLLLIPGKAIREQVGADPKLALTMLGSMARQYRAMVRQIKDLRLRTATQRLGTYLLRLIESRGEGERVVLPYDKKLVAARLDMKPESLSRAIHALRVHGVEVADNEVHITDVEELREFCKVDRVLDRLEEDLSTLINSRRR